MARSHLPVGAVLIVCSCNVLSDAKIRTSIMGDLCPRTPGAVYRGLGCRPNCGRCFATVESLISEATREAAHQADGGGSETCGAAALG